MAHWTGQSQSVIDPRVSGKVALVRRGACLATEKAANVIAAGEVSVQNNFLYPVPQQAPGRLISYPRALTELQILKESFTQHLFWN